MHYKGRPSNYLFQLFLTLLGRPEENSSYFSNVQPCTITCTLDAFINYYDMQVYLQYSKYYITVTKTGGRHPILRPWIRSAEVWGNVLMRMETQQQYNNQDRYVNEFAPPKTWTLPCLVLCIT